MNTKVNFGFISGLEGGRITRGYVPDPEHSRSGVTVATGFDLGQRSSAELHRLFPVSLAHKLSQYAGQKGMDAVAVLARTPLQLTEDEAEHIDLCIKSEAIAKLQRRYNAAAPREFADLPEQAQTVIASVAFQYGDLARRCPKFWQTAINADWQAMVHELEHFGDRYPGRRSKEANYLKLMGA